MKLTVAVSRRASTCAEYWDDKGDRRYRALAVQAQRQQGRIGAATKLPQTLLLRGSPESRTSI